LEQIPFLQNCEDEDSDEDDELDSVQHKKQRVKVSLPSPTAACCLAQL
jgi:striatin 1/3/4